MTDQPTEPPTTTKHPKQKTEYIVLQQASGHIAAAMADEHFTIVGRANASNAQEAIRAIVSKKTNETADGTYVATPARSWQPVTITTRTETRLTLNPAN